MRETYYASFDPEANEWFAEPVTHDFPDNHWVFRVIARSEADAVLKGLECYKSLTVIPPDNELGLLRSIAGQVRQLKRVASETLIIQVDQRLVNVAQKLAEKGFFSMANSDEIILNISSAGWKAIEGHVVKRPARRYEPMDLAS